MTSETNTNAPISSAPAPAASSASASAASSASASAASSASAPAASSASAPAASSASAPRMLLHACCGPCALEPTRIFTEEGVNYDVVYHNPNIYPPEEYAHRLETLREHVTVPQELELIEAEYDPELWEREAAIYGTDREKRCRACYRVRFEETARIAAERGYSTISTTLTISPYQFIDIILEELQAAADRHGLHVDARDFRDQYREATRISREKGMYRQNYCGCRFSIAEAEADRQAARERRKREKEKRKLEKQLKQENIG